MKYRTEDDGKEMIKIVSTKSHALRDSVNLYIGDTCIGFFQDSKLILYKDRLTEEDTSVEIEE